jgi:hypothetical protein
VEGEVSPEQRRAILATDLLRPQARVMRYVANLGTVTVDGSTDLQFTPKGPFRAERLIIRAFQAPIPWWVTFLHRLFFWVRVPWLFQDWDEDREARVWRLRFMSPSRRLAFRYDTLAQRRALGDVQVVSVRVAHQEALVEGIPVAMFSELAFPMRFDLPTAGPATEVLVTLKGKGGPLGVFLIGLVATEEGE